MADPVEDLVQFMLAFTGEDSPVDDAPFAHEDQWSEWTQARMESAR